MNTKLGGSPGNTFQKTRVTNGKAVWRWSGHLPVCLLAQHYKDLWCKISCSLSRFTKEWTLEGAVIFIFLRGLHTISLRCSLVWLGSVLIDRFLVLNLFNIASSSQGSHIFLQQPWNNCSETHILGGQLLGYLLSFQQSLSWIPCYTSPQGWTLGHSLMQWLWPHPHPNHSDWSRSGSSSRSLLQELGLGQGETQSLCVYHLVSLCFSVSLHLSL